MRAFGIGILLAIAAASSAFAGEPAIAPGKTAPSFALKTMNPEKSGKKLVALRNHVGQGAEEPKKAVLLSFAASYCEPCRREIAELSKIEPGLRASGILTAVVVIDTDEEGVQKMKKILVDEMALEIPVLSDRFAILARRYGAEKLPMVVLIDAEGTVRWVHAGYDKKALEDALSAIKGSAL
jgi:peroxiredoxin